MWVKSTKVLLKLLKAWDEVKQVPMYSDQASIYLMEQLQGTLLGKLLPVDLSVLEWASLSPSFEFGDHVVQFLLDEDEGVNWSLNLVGEIMLNYELRIPREMLLPLCQCMKQQCLVSHVLFAFRCSRVKFDAWHAMKKICTPRHHAFQYEFCSQLHDAIFVVNEEVARVLNQKDLNCVDVMQSKPDYILQRVRRLIPPALIVADRLRYVLLEFSQDKYTDPDSGKPLLDVVAIQNFLHFPIIPVDIVTAIRSSNCCCNMPLKRNYDGYATRFFLGFQALSDRPFPQ
ncbi:hypothetical protein MIR68_004333 [Amoeboaphelidium protococcarum]|nr:hypothetical protein MIR68_004333 [Amoeboaphelidium protococcarum]